MIQMEGVNWACIVVRGRREGGETERRSQWGMSSTSVCAEA